MVSVTKRKDSDGTIVSGRTGAKIQHFSDPSRNYGPNASKGVRLGVRRWIPVLRGPSGQSSLIQLLVLVCKNGLLCVVLKGSQYDVPDIQSRRSGHLVLFTVLVTRWRCSKFIHRIKIEIGVPESILSYQYLIGNAQTLTMIFTTMVRGCKGSSEWRVEMRSGSEGASRLADRR
jgi:hypothetical protein